MMLADQDDRTRLRPILAFARVDGKTHFVSRRELVEAFALDRIAMEVDFRSVACVDEAIAICPAECISWKD